MSQVASLVLPPLSTLYGVVTRARLAAYERGLLSVSKLSAPVISIGNITSGGTGKTPLVEWLARALASEGRKVCILTRGYGRAKPKTPTLVSDGAAILTNEPEAGDEPFLLAQNLRGIAAVISDADRVNAGQWALKELEADVLVLDDGFQHLRLARDLDIVAIDSTDPWGGGHLLPYGRLREPLTSLGRADATVLTRVEQANDLGSIKKNLQRFSRDCPMFPSRMLTTRLKSLGDEQTDVSSPIQSGAAFCAIGNPQSFFNHLRREGHGLVFSQTFPDHHIYDQRDVDLLIREAKRRGAKSLITTAKDAVKLGLLVFELPCYVLEIEISIDDKDKLMGLIRNAL
jgi:tetraacyldisaccharide 4'-kinase